MSTADLVLAELDAFDSYDELVDELVRRTAQSIGIKPPTWSWVKGRGRASDARQHVTIPDWAGRPEAIGVEHRSRLFLAQYVVHEVCHLEPRSWGHGPQFKQTERRTCVDVLGIVVKYMRNYPARMLDSETGAELYVSHKEQQKRRRAAAIALSRSQRDELLAAGVAIEAYGWGRVGGRRSVEPVVKLQGEWYPADEYAAR